jgi:hypothetical protein
VSEHSPSLESLYSELPRLSTQELKTTIVELNRVRRSSRASGEATGITQAAMCSFLLGDAHARLGRYAEAFRLWESAVEAGYASLAVPFGDSDLGALVNERRFVIPREENPAPKPRALAFGAFADVCAAWAETVAVVPSAEVTRAQWDAASPCVHYNPATADLTDILACLPAGWRPELIVVSILEHHPLPIGIESATVPRIGWAGDLAPHLEGVHECLGLFDLLVVGQERDVKFARQAGCRNVMHVPLPSLRRPGPTVQPMKPHHDRPVDIAFIGRLDGGPIYAYRHDILTRLRRLRNDYNIVIRGKTDDLAVRYSILSDARIGLNVGAEYVGRWSGHAYGHTMAQRVYETMAMGALCLTPGTTDGVRDVFDVDAELVCFDPDDFEEQLVRRLEDRDGTEAIAHAGRDRVLGEHAVYHRMRDLIAAAKDLTAGNGAAHASGVARHQYLVRSAPDALRPSVSSVRVVPIPPNIRGCLSDPAGDPEARLLLFEEARRDSPGNVIYGLNALLCLVEMEDWFEARQLAEGLRNQVDAGLAPEETEGWLRRQVYLGSAVAAPWWRGDLRMELANARYVDPGRGDAFADYVRDHLRVALRDYAGCCWYLSGDSDAAAKGWQAAYSLDPQDEYAASRLAELRATEGAHDEALTWAARAHAIRPFDARNVIIMALLCERTGDGDGAAARFSSLDYLGMRTREEALVWYDEDASLFAPMTR